MGLTVTIDAMGCQKEIAKAIHEKGADFVLAVKDNQPNLYEDIQKTFAEPKDDLEAYPGYRTQERKHGRVEEREYFLATDLSFLRNLEAWPPILSIGLAQRKCFYEDRVTVEDRYYIGRFKDDERRFGEAVRGHWGIENGLHWVLDITFGEDRNRTRKGHGPENFAVVRHVAVNLLNGYTHHKKCGMKAKRLLASDDCGVREKILNL